MERFERIEWFSEIKKLLPGQSFGELALINDAPRSATVTTTIDCEFAILIKSDYDKVIRKVEARQE